MQSGYRGEQAGKTVLFADLLLAGPEFIRVKGKSFRARKIDLHLSYPYQVPDKALCQPLFSTFDSGHVTH